MKIAVYHPKGGSGRTTLTFAIADYISLYKKKTVQIVETDVQRTVLNSVAVGFQKRHIPVSSLKANAEYVIFDGAPYTKDRTINWLKKMDIILLPVVPEPNDVTALAQNVSEISDLAMKKTFVCLNRVTRPYRNSYKKSVALIEKLLKENRIKRTKTEISKLEAFSLIGGSSETTLTKKNSSGKKALEQIESLLKEIGII